MIAHVAMPPSTAALTPNTVASTTRPSCRRFVMARSIERCSVGGGSGTRERRAANPMTMPATATTDVNELSTSCAV